MEAAFYRRPSLPRRSFSEGGSFASLVPACHFDIHTAIMAQAGADKKPTVVFLARFFMEGLDRRLTLRRNWLQRKKSRKMEKTRKKVQNNFGGTPVFLQNGPVFRSRTGADYMRSL
jgi:hypothetical protein